MALSDEIKSQSDTTFKTKWETRDGTIIPEPSSLKLTNDAVYFKRATVLYADLDGSTNLVEKKNWSFAAEIYKTFLYAAARLIRDCTGSIVSYDGDRVMGIFIGSQQSNDAVSCALKINYAVKQIVQPSLKANYPKSDYVVRHIVGVDTSEIRAARTGVRGDNDLVWVGNSANLAAKLTALSAEQPTWITKAVYDYLADGQKLGPKGENIWKKWQWSQHGDDEIWSTTYWRKF
ncbi:adenylate/guanylate cyclase domain-containing protein [Mesorhizobium sp. M0050]|uniref:adenylate/guanylate cyclase domain-containing protein n=1 Tax=Mesorhizobium sp. M0050 TaxID=2956861 RepID=UPI00333CA3BE